MAALPSIFLDLAIILITAGVITVLFKKLNQPLVLGYIVAGFFIGPYFPWFPVVKDPASVKVWSDIGVVFLMFALGLEFSVKKMKKVGGTGVMAALSELIIMFPTGFTIGRIMGWSNMECIFLGCMLCNSSTSIIVKSFDDLKLKNKKFTSSVTAGLVMDDLMSVLLLVLLSTLSVSRQFDGMQLVTSLIKLAFILVVWFTFGLYLIPTFLRWMRKYITEETLCVVAVGLCFAMVVMADFAGISTALGAFVMGSILCETLEADVINRVITPFKNLFGAVFFVSVGMMVAPAVLVQYIVPILVIALCVMFVKPFAAGMGILISGKSLKTVAQGAFCFGQIGEFSFIIASLGLSFGVIGEQLYPIIVSVSVITNFFTPYLIKGGEPFYNKLTNIIPQKTQDTLTRYSERANGDKKTSEATKFMRKQLTDILIYGIISVALALLGSMWLKPFLNSIFVTATGEPSIWGNVIGCTVTLVAAIPFLWALVAKDTIRSKETYRLWQQHNTEQAFIVAFLVLRVVITLTIIGYILSNYIHIAAGLVIVLALAIFATMRAGRYTDKFYRRIENHFVANLNAREAQHSFTVPAELESYFTMQRMTLTVYSPLVGCNLSQSGLRENYGVSVVSLERAGKIHDLPDKETILMPQDKVTFLGSEEQLTKVRSVVEVEADMLIHDHSDNEMQIQHNTIDIGSPLAGKTLRESNIQHDHHALVIAIQRGDDYVTNPRASYVLQEGDVLWFVTPGDSVEDEEPQPIS